jgi:hypothetical protein
MREGGRGSKTTSDEDLTYIFLSGLSRELTEADIINAIAEHIRVFVSQPAPLMNTFSIGNYQVPIKPGRSRGASGGHRRG